MHESIAIRTLDLGLLSSNKESLTKMGSYMINLNWAIDGYIEALIERENKFPTGLNTKKNIGVAIPHADPLWVKKPAIILGRLKRPIPFASMENNNENVNVNLIFLLSLLSGETHLTLLSALVKVISDDKCLVDILDNCTKKNFTTHLRKFTNNMIFE
jgi:galactitol PTS system EIIA component